MSSGAAPQRIDRSGPSLYTVQEPVREMLDDVLDHMAAALECAVPFIDEVTFHLHQMRGKLFRPALLGLANRVEGEPDEREVALGAVIEMIHLATLVHDDSIDESELRRGLPTLNHRWGHKVSVIMGDYLYSRAMSEITRIGDLALIDLAARVTNDMTIGEMVEIDHQGKLSEDVDRYFYMIEKKTASLVATSCEMGAVIGAPSHREALRRYGHHLGMAFQLIDDLMDYGGEQAVMGKPAGSDLREGQITYPLLAVLPRLEPGERDRVERVLGSKERGNGEEIGVVVELVRRNGGLEATRRRAEEYGEKAARELASLPRTPVVEVLEETVDYVLRRRR
ncbi:MAG: polyprenyl synthetase family protein [Gemmatimonadota bacterium]|nr:polyprenyl synthetase family protein [Gemmatimonadota bacterium]